MPESRDGCRAPATRAPLARPFGHAVEDLELDFDAGDRPALVTALLAACTIHSDPEYWWQRPVSERTVALLRLLRECDRRDSVAITLRCATGTCAERFEIVLPFEYFDDHGPATNTIDVALAHSGRLRLRRPTGADLRNWRTQLPASREEALTAMLTSLTLAGEPQAADVACAAEALAEADPLVQFSVFCTCPACGHADERDIDLEGLVLQRMAALQRALLREVHALASSYGWTEREISAVPPARRRRYIELIRSSA